MNATIRRALGAIVGTLITVLFPVLAFARNDGEHAHEMGGGAPMGGMEHQMTPDGEMIMVMEGLPLWVFMLGIVGIIVVSFVGVEWIGTSSKEGFRINLTKNIKVYDVFKSRWLQAIPQLLAVVVLIFIVVSGLVGSQVDNIAPVFVWTIWWAGLIFAMLFLGPIFCFACPWDGLSNLISRLRVATRIDTLSLKLPYPSWLENMYPAIALFVILTWLELGYGVTTSPRGTAYMGIGVAAAAVLAALLWEKKKFCKWMCPVGRISGIYANFSPIEIRRRNANVCARCETQDCLNGNDEGYPCPTGILLETQENANYCTMCTECFKSCEKRNVALNLRPFGADLREVQKVRTDEAWLAVALLTLTLFHGFSMTSAWENFAPGSSSLLKWLEVNLGASGVTGFTIAMIGVCAIPIVLYLASCHIGAAWANDEHISARNLFLRYSFSLLPVALFYHVAHNAMHLFQEGGHIISLLSDPFGTGADYFGTAAMEVGPLLSDSTLWAVQVGLILVGHLFGIIVAHRIGHSLYDDEKAAAKSLIPMLVVMILISVAGLGLMHLDMNMRMGRM